jgi:predicted enzyme related to lactoylglutathione lyase
MKFVLIYVDKLETCQPFYETYLGFEQTDEFRPGEIYGKCGEIEMWMGEGYQLAETNADNVRATVMLGVDSVSKLFDHLEADGQKIIHEAPVDMGGLYWLQFVDPAGNVVEVLGGE